MIIRLKDVVFGISILTVEVSSLFMQSGNQDIFKLVAATVLLVHMSIVFRKSSALLAENCRCRVDQWV